MRNSFNQKYGFNVLDKQPEDLFEYAASHGLKHLEIHLTKDHLTIDTFTGSRINSLKALSQSHNIQLSFHIPYYINISEILIYLRRSNMNYLKKCVRIAGDLQARHVTLHPGSFYWFPVERWARQKALKRFVKNLRKILKVCEDMNVIMAVENSVPIPQGSDYYLLGDSVDDFDFIFSNLQSDYLRFCLDTGHANMSDGPIKYLNHFKEKLTSIHFHDNHGSNDEHLAVGRGKVVWKEFAAELKKTNFEGPIISECRNVEPHEAASLFDSFYNTK